MIVLFSKSSLYASSKEEKNDPITKHNFLLGKFFMMSEFLGNPKGKVGTFFYLSISNLYSLFTYTTAQNYLLLLTLTNIGPKNVIYTTTN